ncbi:MAG: FGGY-family carbohydrate kinase [Lachnospiraceae bacterium]|nr:FGGY-family carbohydrate kinase [Lachnospiraceae bacterium]MCM1239910.1 FGGY-family carbohydrate kinase [Lachnospiraceae bacterium]MCM1305201.1 FGGY-family carbohydrate kinase [Butyrivibrio sp.]MCM1344666.1 FGGY-family carbohydrate kinase [Muribaculaceae bacterium]MCM1412395.1 FGGY-family carbohydrate kinase [Lachnospiraceae bacterium]
MSETAKKAIEEGRAVLGIEFGSTRIKAVLVDENHAPIAMGTHDWENRLENNIWTYSLEDIWSGLQGCYRSLAEDVREKYGVELTKLGALGFSGMMHGYMPFDKEGELLVPFRTWRNTMTEEACKKLVSVFDFNIPQRWSIAHLYQAVINGEPHVKEIAFFTTLAGYIHWKLSGEKVLGVGEASGMFPIDSHICDYDGKMLEQFDRLVAPNGFGWKLKEILPKVLKAGDAAGTLTEAGAKLLDPTGTLQADVPMCPPEGDAGTGMTATNAVRVRTGNISAGTSIFSMVVTEKALSKVHEEIDMVTTPDGSPVAMVHCNNCTSDLNAWVGLFQQFADTFGIKTDMDELYGTLYREALKGDTDCGGLVSYNYFSGEPVTGLNEGRPLFVRTPDAKFTLANFMRSNLYSAMATLKIGNDILLKEEQVKVDSLTGHGGLFKTPVVGQQLMAAAMNAPVTVMDTASEGGAWGMAILACYMAEKADDETLADYLSDKIFVGQSGTTIEPAAEDVAGFDVYIEKYKSALKAERAAVESLV